MSREEIETEIKEIEQELEKSEEIEENKDLAPVGTENGDNGLDKKENNNKEAMQERLKILRENIEKKDEEITVQKFRTGEEIMLDVIDKFTKLSNTKKKNLLAILKVGAY